jgi:hypothetical protein
MGARVPIVLLVVLVVIAPPVQLRAGALEGAALRGGVVRVGIEVRAAARWHGCRRRRGGFLFTRRERGVGRGVWRWGPLRFGCFNAVFGALIRVRRVVLHTLAALHPCQLFEELFLAEFA